MTADASLPPLTEEELKAASLSRAPIVHRLIAALRASRKRVKELEEWLTSEGYHLD